jgi:hypothetical protein
MMLVPDSNSIRTAEENLTTISKQHTNEFVIYSLEILFDANISENIKKLAITFMKTSLESSINESKLPVYTQLNHENKEIFKKQIMLAVTKMESLSLAVNLGSMIGSLAGYIIENGVEGGWPNLIDHMIEMFQLGTVNIVCAVFRIFDGLIGRCTDFVIQNKAKLFPLIQTGFNSNEVKVLRECLTTSTSLVELSKPKDIREIKAINLRFLQAVAKMFEMKQFQEMEKAVGCIYDICEMEPSFFKQKFMEVLELISTIRPVFADDPNSNFKDQTVECLVMMVERYPEILKIDKKAVNLDDPMANVNKQKLDKITELIFMNMVEVPDEIDPEWAMPPDGFNDDLEENDDQKNIKNGMNFIDRLIQVLGKSIMLKYLSGFIEKMMGVDNWKYKLAALMALSQVGEYMIDKLEDIQAILQLVNNFIQHENPRLRYACCHVLGQFADDLSPKFQNNYHEQFLQMMIPRLEDPIPRVRAHCLAAMTNFLEYSQTNQIEKMFDHIYNKIMNIMVSGITYEKENSLSALASLSESSPLLFNKYYDQSMSTLLEILTSPNKKELKQLRGQSIEAMTIISETVQIEQFEQYVPSIIQQMINIQNQDITYDDTDPQKSYLLAGYQRLCKILGEKMVPFLPQIIPGLIKMASTPVMLGQEKTMGVRTFEKEEGEIAIQMLDVFIVFLEVHLTPYIRDIFNLIVHLMETSLDEETKLIAADCLPSLVRIAKLSENVEGIQPIDYKTFSREVCKKLWISMEKEYEPEILEDQARSLQKVIEVAGDIYTAEELDGFYQICINHLQKSEIRKVQTPDVYDEEEEDKNDIEFLIKEEKEIEEQFTVQIAEIFGSIFKTHKKKALGIIQKLYDNYILKAIDRQMPPKIIKFGLFLIDDAIDHLGEFLPPQLLETFYNILLSYLNHDVLEVRHAATYGIGAFALCLKGNFIKYFDQTIKVITTVQEIKNPNEQNEDYDMTKENVISAVGKMLKVCWVNLPRDRLFNLLSYWLDHLPLVKDIVEGVIQHNFFTDVILSEPEFVLGSAFENLPKVMRIISMLYYEQKQLTTPEMMKKIIQIVQGFVANETIKMQMGNAQLSPQEMKAIEALAEGKTLIPLNQ